MGLLHCFGWDREGAQLRGPTAWPVTITGESLVITSIFCCGCFGGRGGWKKGVKCDGNVSLPSVRV